jgi:hypothetical protein
LDVRLAHEYQVPAWDCNFTTNTRSNEHEYTL